VVESLSSLVQIFGPWMSTPTKKNRDGTGCQTTWLQWGQVKKKQKRRFISKSKTGKENSRVKTW